MNVKKCRDFTKSVLMSRCVAPYTLQISQFLNEKFAENIRHVTVICTLITSIYAAKAKCKLLLYEN